jgi:uncharacterized protein (TIGR03083 family)
VTTTRLHPERYLTLIAADGERLAVAAEGHLAEPVPPCPGWDVAEVVRHTGSVFHHKVACTVLGREPAEGEWSRAPAPGADLLTWYRAALGELLEVLASRAPADPSYTWYPPEQDVGFWQRRMAQETAVHRVDAESATEDVTTVDHDLAVDGIDEVLDVFLRYGIGDDPQEDLTAYDGRAVLVRTGPWAWHISVSAASPGGRVGLRREPGPAQATISGEPSELLLWLWGRRPASAVTVEGDTAAATALRDILVRATT